MSVSDVTTPSLPAFLVTFCSIEQAYHRVLDHVKRLSPPDSGLNGVQLLILVRMPEEGCRVSHLTKSGAYPGTNVDYNLKSLESAGLITREAVSGDGRKRRVSLTDQGLAIKQMLAEHFSGMDSRNFVELLKLREPSEGILGEDGNSY